MRRLQRRAVCGGYVAVAFLLALSGSLRVLFACGCTSRRAGLPTCVVSYFLALCYGSCSSLARVLGWHAGLHVLVSLVVALALSPGCCSHPLQTTMNCVTTARALAPSPVSFALAWAPSARPSRRCRLPRPPLLPLPPPLLLRLPHPFTVSFPPPPRHHPGPPLGCAPCAAARGVRRADPAPVRAFRDTRRGTVLSRGASPSGLVPALRRRGGLRDP